MPKNQSDYSKTIIYKICCKDTSINDTYIGHTTNFVKRKNSHKTSCININSKVYNQYVYQFIRNNGGWDNWNIIQIQEHNCKNKREAEATEHFWIEKMGAKLNSNKPYAMCKEEPQLYKQHWYEEKKDYILQKAKEKYEENKEEKNEYQKQYAKENSEHISEKQKEYREKNKDKLSEQKKEYRESHKEEAAKAHKEWRQANKDKIKTTNSEIIDCECGNQYTFGNKHRHLQSTKHTDYQDKLCGIIEEEEIVLEDKILKEEEEIVLEDKILKEEEEIVLEDKILKEEEEKFIKQKEYREKNAKKIKEQKQKYNDTHKEISSQASKKYYEEHKNTIIEQTKKYAEENKDKTKKYKDDWYQKNKEKILEKQNELFTCECGSEIKSLSKNVHNKSIKHQKYIEDNKQFK
jgi:hypothetical protein